MATQSPRRPPSPSSDDRVTVVGSGGVGAFSLTREEAELSGTIRNLLSDIEDQEDAIPLPNVTSEVLARIVEFCKYRTGKEERDEEVKERDAAFLSDMDTPTLIQVIRAANYLDVACLLDLTCQRVADMLRGKTPSEIRQMFGIADDMTPDDHREIDKLEKMFENE